MLRAQYLANSIVDVWVNSMHSGGMRRPHVSVGKCSRQVWGANRVLCTVLPYVARWDESVRSNTAKRNTSFSDDQVVIGCGPS